MLSVIELGTIGVSRIFVYNCNLAYIVRLLDFSRKLPARVLVLVVLVFTIYIMVFCTPLCQSSGRVALMLKTGTFMDSEHNVALLSWHAAQCVYTSFGSWVVYNMWHFLFKMSCDDHDVVMHSSSCDLLRK